MSWPKLGDEITALVQGAMYPFSDHFGFAQVTAIGPLHFVARLLSNGFAIAIRPDDENVTWWHGHDEERRAAADVEHYLTRDP